MCGTALRPGWGIMHTRSRRRSYPVLCDTCMVGRNAAQVDNGRIGVRLQLPTQSTIRTGISYGSARMSSANASVRSLISFFVQRG